MPSPAGIHCETCHAHRLHTIRAKPCATLKPKELKTIRRLHAQGFSQKEISVKLGRYQVFVGRVMRRYGMTPEASSQGFTYPTRSDSDGKRVRVRVCSVCETETPLSAAETPGVCCRKCGDVRLRSYRVWHRMAGVTVRVRKCLHCGNKSMTSEKLESVTV